MTRSPFRDDVLAGKVAFVAGGTSGIGTMAIQLAARHGARVVATDIDASALAGLEADRRRLDVRSGDEVAALARSGSVEALAEKLVWPALLRKLDRLDPGFRA